MAASDAAMALSPHIRASPPATSTTTPPLGGMSASTDKPTWLFYHLQGERGESSQHPNACKLRAPATAGRVTLEDVLASFPLGGSGAFHFRFQFTTPDKQPAFLDLVNPADVVPTVGGNVVAKVLRIGA